MKTWLITMIAGLALLIGACTPTTFMIGKGEERGVFLGSNAKAYDMLCASGDLVKVLEATHFSRDMKDAFYQYNCSTERSSDKVKQLFASMTAEQRKDIRIAFKANGYSVNGGSC